MINKFFIIMSIGNQIKIFIKKFVSWKKNIFTKDNKYSKINEKIKEYQKFITEYQNAELEWHYLNLKNESLDNHTKHFSESEDCKYCKENTSQKDLDYEKFVLLTILAYNFTRGIILDTNKFALRTHDLNYSIDWHQTFPRSKLLMTMRNPISTYESYCRRLKQRAIRNRMAVRPYLYSNLKGLAGLHTHIENIRNPIGIVSIEQLNLYPHHSMTASSRLSTTWASALQVIRRTSHPYKRCCRERMAGWRGCGRHQYRPAVSRS